MKDFFTSNDFAGSTELIDHISWEDAAQIANEKLNKLIESWPVVFNHGEEIMRYVCFVSTYNRIYGRVKVSANDKYRDVVWGRDVFPRKSRIKPDRYNLYEWI